MRLSTSTNIMNFSLGKPYMVTMEHAISVCAAAGYRYLDANLCGMSRKDKLVSPMTQDTWEQSAKAWRAQADAIGVSFCQGHAYFSVDGPIAVGGVPGGEFGEDMMRRSVLAAEILGVKNLVVHPASVVRDGQVLDEETYAFNLAYFRRWHAFFHAHHQTMAIENMSCGNTKFPSPFADPERLCRLIDELGEPDIGACLDTGHAFLSGFDPAKAVLTLGRRLRATHIADNHGDRDAHVAPFMGGIAWPSVVRALRDIGYQEDFSFETHNLTSPFPMRIQGDLIRFSHTLGEYLLSDDLFADCQ